MNEDPHTEAMNAQMQARQRAHLVGLWEKQVPPRFKTATTETLPDKARASLEAWLNSPDRNVTVAGPVGSGKTHAAWGILRAAAEHGLSCRAVGAVDLIDLLKPSGDPDLTRRIHEADVLLIDDIGAERPTEFATERLYTLTNQRWEWQKPIVTTTNLSRKALDDTLGARTASRLFDGALIIKLADINHRKATK